VTDPPSQPDTPDEPSVTTDFFQGDIGVGLERMRRRLLDLTARNRLLNFRHGKKTSLRVIDELPDILFSRLVDGKELTFKPVPKPKKLQRHPVEQTVGFEVPGDDTGSSSAKEHADSLGLATSFDLPTHTNAGLARHNDKEIQTLLFPDDLESVLRALSSRARLGIEETGTNMLFLAFGFLEWYESEDSNDVRQAPLLLVPVTLTRADADATTRTFRYVVRHSGEEIVENVSLQERLRQDFALALPELTEEDTPEIYFDKLKPLLLHDERWKIRRQVTLTLLSFGKILMYKDLDSANWPRQAGPSHHPRIREFFQGIQSQGIAVAEDYFLDTPAMAGVVPSVVEEADSSQHSALVDALSGRSMVIAGPPGTGKSQTITNLIAAALVRGKNVLFVSEKLAALEVVRHRLDNAGLGLFCLELHSHKAQKRQLLDDVQERILRFRHFRDPSTLDQKLRELDLYKQRLTSYAALINNPFGRGEQTLWDIMWAAQRRRRALSFDHSLVDKEYVADLAKADPLELVDKRQKVQHLAEHLLNVEPGGRVLQEHAWYGLSNTALTFLDDQRLVELLTDCWDHWSKLNLRCAEINNTVRENWIPTNLGGITDFASRLAQLPPSPGEINANILTELKAVSFRALLLEFVISVQRYQAFREEIERRVGGIPRVAKSDMANLRDAFTDWKDHAAKARYIADLALVAGEHVQAQTLISQSAARLAELGQFLETSFPLSAGSLLVLAATASKMGECHLEDLHLRHTALKTEEALPILQEAIEELKPILELRKELDAEVDLSLVPDRFAIKRFALATADTHWWSFVFAEFRAARKAYRVMSKSGKNPSRFELRGLYRRLVHLAEREGRFTNTARYKEVAGPHFRGIETPLEPMLRLAKWNANNLLAVSGGGTLGQQVCGMLWAASRDALGSIKNREQDAISTSSLFTACCASAEKSSTQLPPGLYSTNTPLEDYASELHRSAQQLTATSQLLANAGFPPQLPLNDGPRVLELMLGMESARVLVDNAREVEAALGDAFLGVDTNVQTITRTIAFVDGINRSKVELGVKNWILNPAVADRLGTIHRWRQDLEQLVKSAADSWASFDGFARVDQGAWLGALVQLVQVELGAVINRANIALTQRPTLPAWLDYIRAREAVVASGLRTLVVLAERHALKSHDLLPAVDFIVANSIVHDAFAAHPELAQFSGLSHEQVRTKFAQLDRHSIELYRGRAANTIDRRDVPVGNGAGPVGTFSELSLLEHEISKQRRHIPVRQLVRRAGRALQALKPCFMMGPLSVAQYLAPGYMKFDLVIMDEASQLRPEDAIGSVARGEQLVVVGDRMQLPPTSFFDRMGDEQMEEESERSEESLADAESILDVATVLYRPARLLRWHYRSRHGSLIAYSNKEFYKNKLVVFPSPVPRSRGLGVKLIRVKTGLYEDRRNHPEAERVVEAAFQHMAKRPEESLGIVTLNSTQRELIEEIFEQRLKAEPLAQNYISESQKGLTPFFIKNLENVQGDERDVIYISVTYGPNAAGRTYQRFGPINGPTGHRRLNVLFTRARRRVVVFSSLASDDIQTTAGSAWGLRALKGYLRYAETGLLDQASFTGREPDSEFEVAVAEALQNRGFEVVAQVGVAGYFIDLAVRHPKRTGSFVLGVECDGQSYHSSLSARDRDRLRQSILEDLGWQIHRIWSTDWFKNEQHEVDRLVARIQSLLAQDQQLDVEQEYTEGTVTAEGTNHQASTDDPIALDGEEQDLRLTVHEARDELLKLRAIIAAASPGGEPKSALLRDELIDFFLRTRLKTRDEWLRKVPYELRIATDGDQVKDFLPRVFEITSKTVDL
jgi:very-short-patch-repair endonuclease